LHNSKENLLPEGSRHAELVIFLIYRSTTRRPDISIAAGVFSRFTSCPEKDHMPAAKELLRMLRGASRLGAVGGGNQQLQ